MWWHWAPADARMVVSEIGETWSPQTAPARIEAVTIVRLFIFSAPTTANAIGSRIPKVPQDVPVENASPAAYAQLQLQFAASGAAALVGPSIATAEGGMGGTYIRTIGQTGTASLTVAAPQCEPVTVTFSVTGKENTAWN